MGRKCGVNGLNPPAEEVWAQRWEAREVWVEGGPA